MTATFFLPFRFSMRTLVGALVPMALLAPGAAGAAEPDMAKASVPFTDVGVSITPGPVPARTVQCTLRRATNIDPARNQDEKNIVYEGQYGLTLRLPAVQVPNVAGQGTANADAAPDAGYKVSADPDKLFEQFPFTRFDRVADLWPKHVELGQTVMNAAFQFIILNEIKDQPDHWSIFVSRAADAVTVDVGWIFRGTCETGTVAKTTKPGKK